MFEASFDNESNTTKGTKMLFESNPSNGCSFQSIQKKSESFVSPSASQLANQLHVVPGVAVEVRDFRNQSGKPASSGPEGMKSIDVIDWLTVPREMTWMIQLLIRIGKDNKMNKSGHVFGELKEEEIMIHPVRPEWFLCSQPWIDETCKKAYR